jgi:hypothetical protein
MVNGMSAGSDMEQDEREALPYQEPVRTWAGHGTGALCSLCGLPISEQDIEYEVELAPEAGSRGLQFHVQCYRVWETQS